MICIFLNLYTVFIFDGRWNLCKDSFVYKYYKPPDFGVVEPVVFSLWVVGIVVISSVVAEVIPNKLSDVAPLGSLVGEDFV